MAKKKKKQVGTAPDGAIIIARNKRATHDYEISERVEAGIVLVGSEVKSLRDQRVTLTDGFVEIRGGEAWLVGVQIQPYPWANQFNHEPMRRRKLLLHRREIKKLDTRAQQRGFSLVPLSLYFKDGRVKLEIGVGRGKRQYEKRDSTREKQAQREIDRAMRRE